MTRTRTTLIAIAAAFGGIAGGLAEAQADSTVPTGTDTIAVTGTDTIDIDSSASQAVQQTTYQTALGDALTNAGTKAAFIATQIGATLGSITNVTETSDPSDLCQGPIFLPAVSGSAPATTGARHHHKKARLVHAATGTDGDCSIEADVTVAYEMTPAVSS